MGLDVSRSDAARMYEMLGFSFDLESNEQGQEVYIGTIVDDLAVVTLIGPEDNISSASVFVVLHKPATEDQAKRSAVYLLLLLSVAAEDWKEGPDWFLESLPALNAGGESKIIVDNRDIVLLIVQLDDQVWIDFTIKVVEYE
jgi:hypothetical protein